MRRNELTLLRRAAASMQAEIDREILSSLLRAVNPIYMRIYLDLPKEEIDNFIGNYCFVSHRSSQNRYIGRHKDKTNSYTSITWSNTGPISGIFNLKDDPEFDVKEYNTLEELMIEHSIDLL